MTIQYDNTTLASMVKTRWKRVALAAFLLAIGCVSPAQFATRDEDNGRVAYGLTGIRFAGAVETLDVELWIPGDRELAARLCSLMISPGTVVEHLRPSRGRRYGHLLIDGERITLLILMTRADKDQPLVGCALVSLNAIRKLAIARKAQLSLNSIDYELDSSHQQAIRNLVAYLPP